MNGNVLRKKVIVLSPSKTGGDNPNPALASLPDAWTLNSTSPSHLVPSTEQHARPSRFWPTPPGEASRSHRLRQNFFSGSRNPKVPPPPPPTKMTPQAPTSPPASPALEGRDSPDLPLTMTASTMLLSLPRDATAALAAAGAFPQEKVVVRFKPVGSAPPLRRELVKVLSVQKFETVVGYLRRTLKVQDTESVFLYVNNTFAPALDEVVGNLWRVSDGQGFFFGWGGG